MKIPKKIVQTSPKKQPEYVVRQLKKQQKHFDYIHFDDEEILEFFKRNPIKEFPHPEKIFNHFSNGAHKSDFFRYYYLYLNGGIYIDSDAKPEIPIMEIVKNYDFVSIKSYHTDKNLLFNGFIGCTPQHPIIHDALRDAYYSQDLDLQKDYFKFCKSLFIFAKRHTSKNVRIYTESKEENFHPGVRVIDNKRLILTHYCYLKKVPPLKFGPVSNMINNIVFKSETLYKIYFKLLYNYPSLFSKK